MKFLTNLLRKTPHFKGKYTLLRLLNGRFIKNKKDINIVTKSGIQMTLPNLNEHSCFEIYADGIYESETITLLNSYLKPSSVFIDIGANIGAISLQLAKMRPDITIYSIEASPIVAEYLKQNVLQNNFTNIHILNVAIHEKSGHSMPFYSPEDKIGCGSFSPVFTKKSIEVNCITLDDLLIEHNIKPEEIGIIKIDIEGYETLAIKGAKNLLKLHHPPIYFEFVDWAEKLAGFEVGSSQDWLKTFNYNLSMYKNNKKITLSDTLKKGGDMILAEYNNPN